MDQPPTIKAHHTDRIRDELDRLAGASIIINNSATITIVSVYQPPKEKSVAGTIDNK
jgi:hypothetical protein